MGWQNPPIPWRELERRLSGQTHGDGGDSPAWSRKRAAYQPTPISAHTTRTHYAELHAHSSFSFLDGASSPEELAEEAVRLGLDALAITDHDGVYGVVRLAAAAKAYGLATIFGAELSLDVQLPATQAERLVGARAAVPDPDGRHLLALARDPTGYASLCRGISAAHSRGGSKGRPAYDLEELAALSDGHWLVLTGCRKGPVRTALEAGGHGTFALDPARRALAELVGLFGGDNVAVELTYARDPLADERYDALVRLADEARLPVLASTGAHYHAPPRRPLATALAAVRARTSLDELDGWLPGWADAHLRDGDEMAARFARWPGVVETAARLGTELAFDLHLIAPKLPPFPVPDGHTEMTYLRELAYRGIGRFQDQHKARHSLEYELEIIEELGYPGYFLVVWEITQFCRDRGILCQGRGSAANSAVCYSLEVTAVDAVFHDLMFERFLAPERGEPPDIDIDIESDRREEVIQHVYALHGRDYAAQVANVITYRPKSAVRDVAKALGYSPGQQDAWSKEIEHGYETIPRAVIELSAELQNSPRHLGIHSGGMVICDRPIVEVCPVEWGRMPNRSVLQWDKDDCATIGLVKFDLLGLGMLSALRYSFELIKAWFGIEYDLDKIPKEDPLVYDMLGAADTIGVFQVESRAQMATLPRLKPRTFYDLAIEVALIRPGPIQGNAVHPFIRRHNGDEEITYPHPLLEESLRRTKGVPLFQEQLMQMAVAVAGFSPTEADQLRRAMGAKRSDERIDALRERLYQGMAANDITGQLADSLYDKIKAFASFGFAESHAISFALLVYASSWLKLYHPAAFCAALLNAQPMGFYSPQSLVHDAKRHGVIVHGPHINASAALATLAPDDTDTNGNGTYRGPGPAQPAVRMGLSSVRTIGTDVAERIVEIRCRSGQFTSMTDLAHRVGLSAEQLEALATSGAFDCFELGRRDALWAAAVAASSRPGQLGVSLDTGSPVLPELTAPEQLLADLWATGVTRDVYPTALIRDRLDALGVIPASGLKAIEDRTRVTVGGIVTHRQRPATAHGVTFINLEDETGMVNVICDPVVWARNRRVARESGGLVIRGMLERTDGVVNILAERIDPLSLGLRSTARNFR